MNDSRFGMFLLPINQEDVRRSMANKIFGIPKNTVIKSLLDHPLIYDFLLKENKVAVIYLNNRKEKISENNYYHLVKYYLVKRAPLVLQFLKDEMAEVVVNRVLLFHHANQVTNFKEVISSMLKFLDELYSGTPFTQPNLNAIRRDPQLKGLFQLWLLVYALAKKENVTKETLDEPSRNLRTLLESQLV